MVRHLYSQKKLICSSMPQFEAPSEVRLVQGLPGYHARRGLQASLQHLFPTGGSLSLPGTLAYNGWGGGDDCARMRCRGVMIVRRCDIAVCEGDNA